MRRLPILLAFGLVFVLFVVATATAATSPKFCDVDKYGLNHPKCPTPTTPTTTPTTTTPPQFDPCVFDTDGVLLGWSQTGEPYRCTWTPLYGEDATYSFQIQSKTVETVKIPQLTVNAEAWTPSALCFNEWAKGPQPVPFPPVDDLLWTFSPAESSWGPAPDGETSCADGGPYLLAIRVNSVKGGDVRLVMSPPGELIEGPLDITDGS
jgi:hypothetical protein